ncbi:MAG: helix-turn-helix domain-containing protein [Candidatus Latescibacterota bacterium]|nr:MAG: helix-turn-helix domain-containing protein [Candidatus Latescibacterota bacterium]
MRDRFYSTTELARICGVSISTIKRWTDSGVLRCVRTPGGHRKFRLQDVAEAARRFGMPMATADCEQPTARMDELALLLMQNNRDSLVARLAEHLEVGDASAARQLLVDLNRHGMGLAEMLDGILYSAMIEVRRAHRFGAGDDFVVRRAERLVENAARHLLEQLPPSRSHAATALVAAAPAVTDTLWPALAGLVLVEIGWRVVDLGSDVPWTTLRHGLERERPGIVVVVARDNEALESLRAVSDGHGAELVILPHSGRERALGELVQRARLREEHLAATIV